MTESTISVIRFIQELTFWADFVVHNSFPTRSNHGCDRMLIFGISTRLEDRNLVSGSKNLRSRYAGDFSKPLIQIFHLLP